MSRKIKFRAFDKALNKMFYSGFVVTSSGYVKIISGDWLESRYPLTKNHPALSEESDLILMQYTGLKDIEGEEVYEGDVVEGVVIAALREYNTGVIIDPEYKKTPIRGVVNYEPTMFRVGERLLLGNTTFKETYKELIVVGNIYENLELVEKK